jgi:hypothetical protein
MYGEAGEAREEVACGLRSFHSQLDVYVKAATCRLKSYWVTSKLV